MLTIIKQDIRSLLKNKPIMMYLLIYPFLLILVTGFVFKTTFSDDVLTSYDYYGVTMMIYLSMATVIVLPEMLFGSSVKYANYRIIYSPIARYKIYLSKLLVSIGVSYSILAIYMIIFNRVGLVNFGKDNIGYILLLEFVLIIFSITFGGAFCVLLRSEDIATKILNLVINVLAIVSGLFFPMYIFGREIADIANLSPVAKLKNTFFSIIYDNNFATVSNTMFILTGCSVLFLLVIHFMYRPEKFGG
ncbi:ABC transporter permease [Lactococcus lactis]|uniref:ABC transporter permease n=1 Tax=Lactococcus lactis TaxID=1358 RepID=UPI00117A7900|nr:ABC transporter permease [Lactococcus lactis]TRW68984.1 ABC transporter permease [Lactococcus lactis]